MTIKEKIVKHKIIISVLFFCLLARIYFFPFPLNENLPPLGTGQGNYLHYIEALKTTSIGDWDYSWSAGVPFLTFYPPLSSIIAFSMTYLFSTITAFKLAFFIFFVLTPIAFYYFLKEFKLNQLEKIIALLIFSFTFYFNAIVAVGMQFALIVAFFFGTLFLKFFISSVKNYKFENLFLSILFLCLTALSHFIITLTFTLLSIIYLFSSIIIKFDISKVKRVLFIYIAAFLLSSFWTLPYILEISQNSHFEQPRSVLTAIPFVGIFILYGYYVNSVAILIGSLAILLLFWCLKKEFEIPLRKNVDSTFLKIAIILSFLIYFIIYDLFPQYFPVKADRFINIWIIPFSILFARGINKNIIKYLILLLTLSQIVLFTFTPIQTSNNYLKYNDALNFLSGTENRVTFQPQESGLDLMTLYLAPKYNISLTMGEVGPGLSEKRSLFTGNDILLFSCSERRDFKTQIFSLDILSRKSLVYLGECKLLVKNYKEIFDMQHTGYVVADRSFPSVVNFFNNDSDFKPVAEFNNLVVFEYLNQKPYVDTTPKNIQTSYKKERNQISIYLKSDIPLTNVSVRLSEGWYPLWKSNDVSLEQDELGYIKFNITQLNGEKKIVLNYIKPHYYEIGRLVSIISLFALILLLIYNFYNSRRLV